jgi:hypothetical protein
MTNGSDYVIRISKLANANKLYWSRIYYAKLRRNWTQGSKLIFLTKTSDSDEAFIGLGKIEVTYELSELDLVEKKICIENNCHLKIVFSKMVRFIPAVPINDVQPVWFSKIGRLLLDGTHISEAEISKIERLAKIMIIR